MEDFDADVLEALLAGAGVTCPGAENNVPPVLTFPQGGVVGGAEGEGESRSSAVGGGSGGHTEGVGNMGADETEDGRQGNRSADEERRSETERDSERVDPNADRREPPTPPARSGTPPAHDGRPSTATTIITPPLSTGACRFPLKKHPPG